jgi:O-antigen ligase/polysaccharide polymerase Wzy-like membrane protein
MALRPVKLTLALFVVSVPLIGWAVELGVALTAPHFVGLAVIALAAATWWRERRPFPAGAAVLSLLMFFVVATVTVVVVQFEPNIQILGESSHAKSIKQLIGLGFGAAVFISLYSLMRWYDLGLTMLRVHYWTTVVVAVLALLQYGVAVLDLASPMANFPVNNSTLGAARPLSLMYGFPRVSLTMVEPSMLASYLLTGWAFWLYTVERPSLLSERTRAWFLGSGVVLGVAVVVSGSRQAYVVFILLLLVALVARPNRIRRAGLVAVSLLIGFVLAGPKQTRGVVATLAPKMPPPASISSSGASHAGSIAEAVSRSVDETAKTVEVVAKAQDISVQQRTASYLVALRVFRERPLLGAGLGTSGFYMERYWPASFTPLYENRTAAPTMLSSYAAIAAETGLLGVLCAIAFAVAVLARLWRLALHVTDGRTLAWGLAASLGGYAIGSAATALMVYQTLLGWLLLAVVLTATTDPAAQPVLDEGVVPGASLKNRPSIWSMRPDRRSMNPGSSA